MRINLHIEDIRHLFIQHAPEIVLLAAAWPRDEAGNPIPSPEDGRLPQEFEDLIIKTLWGDKDPHERSKPHEAFKYVTRRPSNLPPDAKSSRTGTPRDIPDVFRAVNPSMPKYESRPMVNRQFDEANPDTPHLDVNTERIEYGQPGVAQDLKSAHRYTSGESAGLSGIHKTGGTVRTVRCAECPLGACVDCPGPDADVPAAPRIATVADIADKPNEDTRDVLTGEA